MGDDLWGNPATSDKDDDKDGRKFQKLVVETTLLYNDRTWKAIQTTVNPKFLRSRDCSAYDIDDSSLEELSEESTKRFLVENPKFAENLKGQYMSGHYYEYPDVMTKVLFGDD